MTSGATREEREQQRRREAHERAMQQLEREQHRLREETDRGLRRLEQEQRRLREEQEREEQRHEQDARSDSRKTGHNPWRELRDELRNELRNETRRAQPSALNLEQIVRAAIEIADQEGNDAISMRRIAAKLKAGAMSLYWHVANKDELIQLMVDEAYTEMDLPAESTGDWRADIRTIAIETRQLFLRHPWIARLGPLGRSALMGPGFLRHAEFSFAAFEAIDLANPLRADIVHVVDDYTIGFVTREIMTRALVVDPNDETGEWRQKASAMMARMAESGLFPVITRIFSDDARFPEGEELDRLFLFGLDSLLDGIALRIDRYNRAEPD